MKSASVKRSIKNSGQYTSDQGAVWDEVNELHDKTHVRSPTSAMGDVYDAKSNDLEDFIKSFEIVDGQNGLLVFVDNEIMGLNVVSSESAYKHLHKKLIKSYALDSMVKKDIKNANSDINIDLAHKFLKENFKSEESKNKSVGYGFDYKFTSNSYIGSSLVCKDDVIHASFFKSLEDEEIGRMARYSTRTNIR